MKKTLILAAAVAALAMLASSCQKENPAPVQAPEGLVFTATIDNSATKTTIDASTGKVSWVDGDEITIGANNIVYVATPDASDASKATLAKKNSSDADPTQNGDGNYEATYGPSDLTAQTYSATAGKLPMSATSGTTSLNFSVTCGLLKLSLTKTGESIKSIAVSNGTNTYTLTCETAQSIETAKDFFIALPAGAYNKIVLTNADDKTCTIDASAGGVTITTNQIKPLIFASRISFAAAAISGTAKAKLDGTNEVDVTWVQLWKNGPKWATINVGVTSTSATGTDLYGGLYRWGGTNEMRSNTSASDDHNTGTDELTHTGDNPTDTATKLWGSNWRMPTQAELNQLRNYADDGSTALATALTEWGTFSGGFTITGKGDYASNSIFLPSAGYFFPNNKKVFNAGSVGYYWSSTPAFRLSFYSDNGLAVDSATRTYGYSVRAVLVD